MRSDELFQKDGIGFHLPGAFDKVLDIDHCYLQADPSNGIRLFIKQLSIEQQWPFFNLKFKTGFVRNVIVRTNQAGEAMIVLVVGEANLDWIRILVDTSLRNFHRLFRFIPASIPRSMTRFMISRHNMSMGARSLIEQLHHVRFHIGPKSFFQTNSQQAANLYALTKQLAALQPGDNVYDLYCGVGSLGIYMADSCQKSWALSKSPKPSSMQEKNAELNALSNTEFCVGQVELLLDPAFVAQAW